MPWSASSVPNSVKNKSLHLRSIFAKVANAALDKGQTEEEATFAGLAAVNLEEKKNKPKEVKKEAQKLPSHIQAILDAKKAQGRPLEGSTSDYFNQGNTHVAKASENASEGDLEGSRDIVDAEFNKKGQLVLKFSDGSRITTDESAIKEYIEQHVVVTAGLTNPVDFIDFNEQAGHVVTEGQLAWNATDGTLDLGLKGGNVTLQIGQEQHVHIYNNTANDFTDLQVLRITGSQGQRLTGALAQANSEITSSTTFAVVTELIAKNTVGFATTSGLVRNVNTSAFPEGAALYLSPTTAGGLTHIKPTAPNHMVLVGWCVRSNANNGSIYVHVQNGYELEELHNVKITDLQNGHILKYDSALGYWKNVNPAAASGVTTASYFQKVNLVANTPLTITHSLGTIDRDAFTLNAMLNNKVVNVDVQSVDTNSLTLTSKVAVTDLAVTIIGVIA